MKPRWGRRTLFNSRYNVMLEKFWHHLHIFCWIVPTIQSKLCERFWHNFPHYPDSSIAITSLIARSMRPTWDPPGADRTQVGPMLAQWTLLYWFKSTTGLDCLGMSDLGILSEITTSKAVKLFYKTILWHGYNVWGMLELRTWIIHYTHIKICLYSYMS